MDDVFINKTKEVTILNNQDLTKSSINVKGDLPKYWEKEYINQKIQDTKNHQHKMLLKFLWMTGVRITEAVSIRKKDLDFKNYMMQVRWLKNRKYNYRVVPMHPLLKDVLELYTAGLNESDLVFPISRQRAWQVVKKNLNGHPHQFRHSFAVNWLRCGGDVIILSRILGHSKVQTTMEYLKIVPIDQGKELLKIEF